MVSKVKLSAGVRNQLPMHLRKYDDLASILKSYYEWTEADGNFQKTADDIDSNMFVAYADADFIQFFVATIIPSIPSGALIDKKLLIRYAKEFYQSKGSEQSFKFLFRILYNQDVEISYPKTDIFRTSAAVYRPTIELLVAVFDDRLSSIVNRRIVGLTSGANAIVDSIEISGETAILKLQGLNGAFIDDEPIKTDSVSGLIDIYCRAIGVASVSRGFVGDDSMLSGTKKLQDGVFYQEFSYVLKSKLNANEYRIPVDKLVHPSGTKRFSKFDVALGHDASVGSLLNYMLNNLNDQVFIGTDSFNKYRSIKKLVNIFPDPINKKRALIANGQFIADGSQEADGIINGEQSFISGGIEVIGDVADVQINVYADTRIIDITSGSSGFVDQDVKVSYNPQTFIEFLEFDFVMDGSALMDGVETMDGIRR